MFDYYLENFYKNFKERNFDLQSEQKDKFYK